MALALNTGATRHINSRSLDRIAQGSVRIRNRRRCDAGWFDRARPEYMPNRLAGCEKVIRYNPAMAAPPDSLGAHYGAALGAAQLKQFGKAGAKAAAHRIVGIIVKTLIFPITVCGGRNVSRVRASTSQFPDIGVADLKLRQRLWKRLAIILRICPRARNTADVNYQADARGVKQFDKLLDLPGGMTDREEWRRHLSRALQSAPATAMLKPCESSGTAKAGPCWRSRKLVCAPKYTASALPFNPDDVMRS
jgi:hypothetical protein